MVETFPGHYIQYRKDESLILEVLLDIRDLLKENTDLVDSIDSRLIK